MRPRHPPSSQQPPSLSLRQVHRREPAAGHDPEALYQLIGRPHPPEVARRIAEAELCPMSLEPLLAEAEPPEQGGAQGGWGAQKRPPQQQTNAITNYFGLGAPKQQQPASGSARGPAALAAPARPCTGPKPFVPPRLTSVFGAPQQGGPAAARSSSPDEPLLGPDDGSERGQGSDEAAERRWGSASAGPARDALLFGSAGDGGRLQSAHSRGGAGEGVASRGRGEPSTSGGTGWPGPAWAAGTGAAQLFRHSLSPLHSASPAPALHSRQASGGVGPRGGRLSTGSLFTAVTGKVGHGSMPLSLYAFSPGVAAADADIDIEEEAEERSEVSEGGVPKGSVGARAPPAWRPPQLLQQRPPPDGDAGNDEEPAEGSPAQELSPVRLHPLAMRWPSQQARRVGTMAPPAEQRGSEPGGSAARGGVSASAGQPPTRDGAGGRSRFFSAPAAASSGRLDSRGSAQPRPPAVPDGADDGGAGSPADEDVAAEGTSARENEAPERAPSPGDGDGGVDWRGGGGGGRPGGALPLSASNSCNLRQRGRLLTARLCAAGVIVDVSHCSTVHEHAVSALDRRVEQLEARGRSSPILVHCCELSATEVGGVVCF